jgi:DNA topoisomerase I
MDSGTSSPNRPLNPGLSVRMGPVDDMDVDSPAEKANGANGQANGKRKARTSTGTTKSYKEASSSEEDDKPLVRTPPSSSP